MSVSNVEKELKINDLKKRYDIVVFNKMPQERGVQNVMLQQLSTYNGLLKAKEMGKLKVEGKDYVVCDGDIINFRFNV